MEHAFGCCNRNFSSNFDIYWEIDFPCNGRPLHIDDSNSFDAIYSFEMVDFIDQIFGFPRLAYQHNCFIFYNIIVEHLSRIKQRYFLEAF